MIKPHGGKLVNRTVSEEQRKVLKDKIFTLKSVKLNKRQISDLEMIATGAFSPLEGFMCKEDYLNVLHNMRLANGIVWPIPITLAVDEQEAKRFEIGEDICLLDEFGKVVGLLHLEEIYSYDKELEAEKVYRTKDKNHPGVNALYSQGDVLLAGPIYALGVEPLGSSKVEPSGSLDFNGAKAPTPEIIEIGVEPSGSLGVEPLGSSEVEPSGSFTVLKSLLQPIFLKYYLTPQNTRKIFKERGWNTIVGFQTRNPIHRAHEYIQKCALEIFDGLFIHPIVGETKSDDVPAEVRMKCYEVLIENYYPKDRVVLAINPAYMRYAGPREAIFHAIVRKNYGCTHFIVGRDHAGVGNYYGPYDAQKIFYEFKPEELEIVPLFFENAFYCKKCGSMASSKTCPHGPEEKIMLSGTKVRQMLQEEEIPPLEFTRPEIAKILIEAMKKKRTDYNI